MKLGAKELRNIEEKDLPDKLEKIRRIPIYFILEDVLDTYNIGGLFRLADALAIEKVYLCGGTETPPNHRIKKASIGTYKVVPWEYKATAKEAIRELRNLKFKVQSSESKKILNSKFNSEFYTMNSKLQIIAIEQAKNSVDYRKINYSFPLALVVGNETEGIKPETLKLCNQIAEIPMWGINKSLNVIVSAAIVSYRAIDNL